MLTSDEMLLTFLVNAAWQIPAVVGLAAITSRLLRKGPASYRHLVWVVAMIAAVIVPVLSAQRTASPPRSPRTYLPCQDSQPLPQQHP